MKKLILSLMAVVIAAGSYAQDNSKSSKSPEEKANKRADKLKTELGLNDDQRAKVYTAVLEKMNKMEATKTKYSDIKDKKAKRAEMKAIQDNFEATMKSILTSEQYTKWETMKAEKKKQKKEKKSKS